MRVLLDTCAISELGRDRPNPDVRRAVADVPSENLFLSVLTLGEIAKGIALLDDGKRRRSLQSWLTSLERDYAEQLLEVDAETSAIWGELAAAAQKAGHTVGAVDGLIAATARRHGLHVMTRNVADFAPTGVLLINPWSKESREGC